MKQVLVRSLAFSALVATTGAAHAADVVGASAGSPPSDEPRFRFGASGGLGFFTVKSEAGNQEAPFTYYGADLRFGYQLDDLIGVYAQPTLGYYTADEVEGLLAVGGLLGVAVAADFTFLDRFFVGGGLGYTIYNNPSGLSALLRVGAYPLMGRGNGARRHGLMLGIDLHLTNVDGFQTIVMPTLNVGYEAF
jgi:hypothetical protein